MNKNVFKTYVLLAALGGFLILIGRMFLGDNGPLIGLGLGLAIVGGSYWFSDKLAIRASKAQPVTEEQAPRLYQMVRELTTRGNLPMPRLYMIPSDQPNAFATGRSPRKAAVAVTEGIMKMLPEEELRGVIAHELAHVRNRDILIGSVAAAVATGITYVGYVGMFFGGGDDDDGGGIGGLLMFFLAPMAAGLLQMALSRSREFEADRTAATMIGTGEPLARALEKMEVAAKQLPMRVNPAQASAYIVNPLSGRKKSMVALFSTHPPTEQRIERLRGWRPGL
ncbi:MAG TPA: M48 family metalloprotease [Actinomycetota bacterium]|nr:M48 family metalloprotease [Actinomycetota bacterium]